MKDTNLSIDATAEYRLRAYSRLTSWIGMNLGKDEIWQRLPDSAMKDIDPALAAKYASKAAAPAKPKTTAAAQ